MASGCASHIVRPRLAVRTTCHDTRHAQEGCALTFSRAEKGIPTAPLHAGTRPQWPAFSAIRVSLAHGCCPCDSLAEACAEGHQRACWMGRKPSLPGRWHPEAPPSREYKNRACPDSLKADECRSDWAFEHSGLNLRGSASLTKRCADPPSRFSWVWVLVATG